MFVSYLQFSKFMIQNLLPAMTKGDANICTKAATINLHICIIVLIHGLRISYWNFDDYATPQQQQQPHQTTSSNHSTRIFKPIITPCDHPFFEYYCPSTEVLFSLQINQIYRFHWLFCLRGICKMFLFGSPFLLKRFLTRQFYELSFIVFFCQDGLSLF